MKSNDLSYPAVVRQPRWVLQSASADRTDSSLLVANPEANAVHGWALIQPGWNAFHEGDEQKGKHLWKEALAKHPNNIFLLRTINNYAPEIIYQTKVRLLGAPWGKHIAVIVPGELRCWKRCQTLFESLARHADIFICTSPEYADAAKKLAGNNVKLVERNHSERTGAMEQWHKLAETLSMVRLKEKNKKQKYTHILKLRTDFHHVQPKYLLSHLVSADGLICSSDKVFGGARELMMLFEGFYTAITGWFDEREEDYWPINLNTILKSDDSSKWYGMNFPKELVGEPTTVEELRTILIGGGDALAQDLQKWKPSQKAKSKYCYMKQLHRIVPGYPRFASEICFARFLNFNGINTNSAESLLGFLRSDRHIK